MVPDKTGDGPVDSSTVRRRLRMPVGSDPNPSALRRRRDACRAARKLAAADPSDVAPLASALIDVLNEETTRNPPGTAGEMFGITTLSRAVRRNAMLALRDVYSWYHPFPSQSVGPDHDPIELGASLVQVIESDPTERVAKAAVETLGWLVLDSPALFAEDTVDSRPAVDAAASLLRTTGSEARWADRAAARILGVASNTAGATVGGPEVASAVAVATEADDIHRQVWGLVALEGGVDRPDDPVGQAGGVNDRLEAALRPDGEYRVDRGAVLIGELVEAGLRPHDMDLDIGPLVEASSEDDHPVVTRAVAALALRELAAVDVTDARPARLEVTLQEAFLDATALETAEIVRVYKTLALEGHLAGSASNPIVGAIATALTDAPPTQRGHLAEALGELVEADIPGERGGPPMTSILDDLLKSHPRTQETVEAVRHLVLAGVVDPACDRLWEWLATVVAVPAVPEGAYRLVSHVAADNDLPSSAKQVAERITDRLNDATPSSAAIEAVGDLAAAGVVDPASVPADPLRKVLVDGDRATRVRTARTLGELAATGQLPADRAVGVDELSAAVRGPDPLLRATAVKTLSRFAAAGLLSGRDELPLGAILRMVREATDQSRVDAACALKTFVETDLVAPKRIVETMTSAGDGADRSVRPYLQPLDSPATRAMAAVLQRALNRGHSLPPETDDELRRILSSRDRSPETAVTLMNVLWRIDTTASPSGWGCDR